MTTHENDGKWIGFFQPQEYGRAKFLPEIGRISRFRDRTVFLKGRYSEKRYTLDTIAYRIFETEADAYAWRSEMHEAQQIAELVAAEEAVKTQTEIATNVMKRQLTEDTALTMSDFTRRYYAGEDE